MTAYIKFTALSGARNEDPLCYLLEIDEAKLLLDCGWTDDFNPEDLKQLRRVAKQVDAVLISHADIEHLGAYPYALGNLGLNCPAYATTPIHDMGQICMYDAYQSKCAVEDFSTFTLDHVDTAFEKMVSLRYSQPFSLSGRCKGITITAYAAGHSIGGTIWKIKKDTDEVVYAVDYNHKRDRHLNGTVLINTDALARPSVLITDAYNAKNEQPLRKARDAALIDTIAAGLSADANVLIPVDSSTRILELAYLYRTMTLARTMLEWMGDGVSQAFSQRREVPFDFKYLRMLYRMKDLEKIQGPKIVLASLSSLDVGWSHQLLQDWGEGDKNIIILPDRGLPGSMTRKLYEEWDRNAPQQQLNSIRLPIELQLDIPIIVKKKIPLEGDELAEFLAREQQRREQEAEALAKQRALIEDDESDISEDDEQVGEVANILATGYDIFVKDQTRTGGFFKQSQSYRMFPIHDNRKRVDDYGEQIDPTVYMRGEYQYALQQAATEAEEGPEPMDMDKMRPEEDKIPSKYVSHDAELKLRCKVMYIDFEGRSDGRSIRNILPQVSPRKLILIHGSEEATDDLAQYCIETESMTNEVYTPHVSECINVSAATNIYQVKLTDSLVSSLQMASIADYELAYVTGIIRFPNDDSTAQPSSTSPTTTTPTTTTPGQIPILDIIPSELQTRHQPVIVGDLKLSEFRRILQQEGFSTEFVSGVLVVNGNIVVRRSAAGRLAIEGPVGDNYYKIRSLLYGQHAIL